jgi:7-carboxy-7-deazaguanine synthase
MLTLVVNEVFYSLQGEGARAGTPNTFVRLSGCNLQCRRETEGFDCDTEFTSGRRLHLAELMSEIGTPAVKSIIWTGGEPGLQLDGEIVVEFSKHGFWQAAETNGTHELPAELDWVSMSPKTAEHTLIPHKNLRELRYVRRHGMGIPKPSLKAEHLFISPAAGSDGISRKDLEWCIDLVRDNPGWKLSVQQHKLWGVR